MKFNNYPNLKLGFTTAIFLNCVNVTMSTSLMFLEYAKKQGFSWMELRDPEADLTYDECCQLAAYANTLGVEIAYAIHRAPEDTDFWPIVGRGIQNAQAFKNGPRTLRIVAGREVYAKNPWMRGWGLDDFTYMVNNAEKAARIAASRGIRLVVENYKESMLGDSYNAYYGLDDLLDKSQNVGWAFNTANPFSATRSHITPQQALGFMRSWFHRMEFVYLKASKQKVGWWHLGDNPLPFKFILPSLAKGNKKYVCIDQTPTSSLTGGHRNIRRSLEYLRRTGILRCK